MDTDGTVSEVKVAHTGDPEVGYKYKNKEYQETNQQFVVAGGRMFKLVW